MGSKGNQWALWMVLGAGISIVAGLCYFFVVPDFKKPGASTESAAESPLGDSSELPPGNWKPLSAKVVGALERLGFERGEEWALDQDNPRRLLVSSYRSPIKSQVDFPLFSMDQWEPGPRSWDVITVAAELAGEMEKALPVSGFNPKYLWPVFLHYRQFPIQFTIDKAEVLGSFSQFWWKYEGVPRYVGEWFLANLPYEPHSVYPWVAIYRSGVPVPEAVLKSEMERELAVHRKTAAEFNDETAGYSNVAWIARVCRKQYPDSRWWQENPEVMAALEFQDKHDGSR